MMEEQLRQLLKEHGWHLFQRTRGKRHYFYAQKWKAGEVYITSLANLPALTAREVLEKIKVS